MANYIESDIKTGAILTAHDGSKWRVKDIKNSVTDLENVDTGVQTMEFIDMILYRLNAGTWAFYYGGVSTLPNDPSYAPYSWERPKEQVRPEPTCTCDIRNLSAYGCKCGFIEYERSKRK